MKKYIILLIVLILISCQCNKGKGFPSDRYVDNIQHIEYKIQEYHMGSVLTVGDVQITFAPNGHIMGIKNKSLKDGHIRHYYFLDKRDKDEISHFYTIKNGLDGVAVFYHCENIIDHVDFYKNNELIYSKKTMMKDKIFVIILSACTVCFCSCKNKTSDDFKCVYADSIHRFEYYRNTDQIVIRVDSNILYFTPDNRLQQVCTRSSFRNQKLSLKGKVFFFNKKTGFLDSLKYDHKDMKHSRTIVYDENGCIIRQ